MPWEIEDPDTHQKYVVSTPKQPTQEQAAQIFKLKTQEKAGLKQADEASNMGTHVKNLLKTSGPEIAGSALMTAVAPEFGLPLMAGSLYGLGKQGYETYKNPDTLNKVSLAGQLAQTLLPLGIKGVSKISPKSFPTPVSSPSTDYGAYESNIRSAPSYESQSTEPFTGGLPRVVSRGAVEGQIVDTVPNDTRNVNPVVIPPPTTNPARQIDTPQQLQFPLPRRVFNMPGKIKPSKSVKPSESVTEEGPIVTRPKTGYYNKPIKSETSDPRLPQVYKESPVSSQTKTLYYKGESGKTIPQVNAPGKVGEETKTTTPESDLETPKSTPETKSLPGEQTKQLPKQEEIENKWLRGADTTLLQTMRPGSTGKMANEIDTVLKERGLEYKEHKGTGKSESGLNEQAFNEYNQLLADLPSHGKNTGSILLRDITELGRKAGLDKDTIKNDLLENLHPETTNPQGRAGIAIQRVFSPPKENE